MNLLLDFLKSRRSARWLGHVLGLLAAGVWLSLDIHPLAGFGVAMGLGAGLWAFEVVVALLDRRNARLKRLAPDCFPLKNLAEADRAFVQGSLALMPVRSVVRALVAWSVATAAIIGFKYNVSSALLALSLGAPVSALAQGWGNALLLKRVLPFFYFEGDYARNFGTWLPKLDKRFHRSLWAPFGVLLPPLLMAFLLQHELSGWALLWIGAWTTAAVFTSAWALEALVVEPISDLRHALARFGSGDLQSLLDVTSGDELGHATETYNKTLRAVDRRFFILENFGHSVAPGKSDAIFEGGLRLDGEKKSVALLECEWHNAGAVTRGLEATAQLGALNRFYEAVQDAVDKAHGSVFYVGEGRVLALWGAPLADEQPVNGALAAAWSLQAHLKVWANQTRARGGEAVAWGMGVAHGQATLGLLGPRQRQRYAVLGGPVDEVRGLAQREGGPWLDERSAAAAKAPFAVQITPQGPQLIGGPEPEAPNATDLGFKPGEKL